ncbi:MAG TPA: hypothetical protein VFN87_17615 [Solirubrobacteraceae bacterium]|nr:hypothetical protein [Solirubrobacteraceae bacterium]
MASVPPVRRLVAAVAAATAALGCSSAMASGGPVSRPAAVTPPKVVRAARITRPAGTLAPGSPVQARRVTGQRVFTDARHGVALASVGSAEYAVATSDGGRTWKTDGPALHLDAAQAPLSVAFIGAVNRRTVFAWGGGQVIDATSDGGRHWYRALFTTGVPVGVVHDFGGRLVAFVSSSSSGAWQYISRDGGRTWRLQATVTP